MGCVFSCFSTVFIWVGELLENVCLAMGEIGAVLVRAVVGILVSLCDCLAAVSCCYRVPWSERPDRSDFIFTAQTTELAANNTSTLASVGGKRVLWSTFTKEGREQKRQIKAASKKVKELKAEAMAMAKAEKKEAEAREKAAIQSDKEQAALEAKAKKLLI